LEVEKLKASYEKEKSDWIKENQLHLESLKNIFENVRDDFRKEVILHSFIYANDLLK
jgi:hypothetical protein